MATQSAKVVVRNARLSYFNGWHPTKMKDSDKEKYNSAILIAKDNPVVAEIKKILDDMSEEAKKDNGGKLPGTTKNPWHNPLNDGDVDKPGDENYAGMYYLNAKSDTKPGIVSTTKDADGRYKAITDESEVYSGCYAHVSLSFFRFGKKGDMNFGIGVGLNNIMKVRDGEPLAGKASAQEDFENVVVEDDELDLG